LAKIVKKFNRTINIFKNRLLHNEGKVKIDRISVYNLNNQICIRGKAGGKLDHVDVC
jgi:hypothetical protein